MPIEDFGDTLVNFVVYLSMYTAIAAAFGGMFLLPRLVDWPFFWLLGTRILLFLVGIAGFILVVAMQDSP